MTRDRSVATEKKSRADNDLTAARARLIDLEKRRPSANNSGALYQWNLAHSDAVAVAKNATNLIATQQRVVDSFNNRIGKAETERNEAKAELDGATISP